MNLISIVGWPRRASVKPAGSNGVTFYLKAAGEFDQDNVDLLTAPIRRAVTYGYPTVTVDFERVTFIDAGVVGALVACQKLAVRHGCMLRIAHASGMPSFVLDATGTREALCGPD